MKNSTLFGTAALAAALLGAGCASTATGVSRSAVQLKVPPQTLQATAPTGSPLVVLRYPAVVETEAQDAYYNAFFGSPIGGRAQIDNSNQIEAQNIADGIVVKSNYFALSLYKELAERLPEHSVLLSPHAIKLADDGSLTSAPITQAESLGDVMTIDFAAYSFPDPEKMMGSEPLTFGDLVTPLVTVRGDHKASAPTQGVLMASQPLLTTAGGSGRDAAQMSLSTLQSGRFDMPVPELDFISYLSGGPKDAVPAQGLTLRAQDGAAQVLPMEKIKIDGGALQASSGPANAIADPLEAAFSSAFADRIIALLNDTDVQKASMSGRAAAIAQFDDSLAALTLMGSSDADYQARFKYAERLLEAQQKYLSVQSLRIYDGIQNGEMGAQVRDMLMAEHKVLEERRDLARKQNQATALAVLGAVAAGAAAANSGDNFDYTDYLLVDTLSKAAIFAGMQAYSMNRQSKAVGKNYLSAMVPALEEQTSVQVNLLESSETITAIRFEDLREKLQALYNKNQRALDTIATRCGFKAANGGADGTWLGVCENGLAAGSGVGVIRNPDGSAIEYYGYAQNGMAHGAGFQLSHTQGGTSAIEGMFAMGAADGVMKVSRPGAPDQLRVYSAGRDAGSAPAGSRAMSPFENQVLAGAY